MTPRLVYSPLTGRVLVVTRYRDRGRFIVASDKRYVFDVTEEYEGLRKRRVRIKRAVSREARTP